MLKLAARLFLLLGLNALLGLGILYGHRVTLPGYEPWESDSVLLRMPSAETFDLAFLGASHAYLFTRFEQNARITTQALDRSLFNMALPTGGGVRPARLYFEEFLSRGNRCDTLVYFLDPFVLFSTGANDAHKFVYFEPLELRFLARLLRDGYPKGQIATYVRSKFTADWLLQHPEPLKRHPRGLTTEDVDPERIAMRMRTLYLDGVRRANFDRYREEFLRIARGCREEGIQLVVIVPPTLLGPEPGAEMMDGWMAKIAPELGISFHDLSGALPEPALYYNLDHLNTAGVKRFMENFVRPILDEAG